MERSSKTLGVAIGIVAVIAIVIGVLVSGGGSSGGADAGGDVTVESGPGAPEDIALADIAGSEVRREGDQLVFEAEMAKELPSTLPNGSLELRWDLSEGGKDTWIVTASITVDLTAAVTAQETGYSSTTINDTLPGDVSFDGERVVLTLNTGRIDGFPDAFEWELRTTLDADLGDPSSAVARDTAPDGGPGRVDG